jgi:segregation and condensation protein B
MREAPAEKSPDGSIEPSLIAPAIEAILMSLDKPVRITRLAEALGLWHARDADDDPEAEVSGSGADAIREAVDELNETYERTGRSFRIESVAGGYRIMTLPEFSDALGAFHASRSSAKLSRAALETLAIVAYKQPITRAQLEAIRGVACGEVLRTLLERRLLAIVGRAEELGRPMLYGTSKRFLETFGLKSIKDLPSAAELRLSE